MRKMRESPSLILLVFAGPEGGGLITFYPEAPGGACRALKMFVQ